MTPDGPPKPPTLRITRTKKEPPVEDGEESPPVTQGAIEKIVDYMFNPSRDKIREVTFINQMQARYLPQLDVVTDSWAHLIEVAEFRQDPDEYKKKYKRQKPVPPNLIGVFVYRTAQWNKSIGGFNLKEGMNLALAETEAKGDLGDDGLGAPGGIND